jgi:hypothetical protein
MASYDCTKDFQQYYDNHVRLSSERKKLAEVRDTNLQRIREGLADLENETKKPHPSFSDSKNQGGYAMHTLNQAADNDYDIDVALVFESDDLPDDPGEAKLRVRDALRRRATNFVTEPEARTNAVTVWYEEGYHVDFAIYRRRSTAWSTITEHASSTWIAREPLEVSDWFCGQVDDKSPAESFWQSDLKVGPKQMRRIVRFIKRFCKSRASWNLPGGMIITTLVNEVYQPDRSRDDISLRSTLTRIQSRLEQSLEIMSPVRPEQELTASEKHKKQVERLLKKLNQFLPKLAVLDEPLCTEEKARNAWNFIFNHEFWKQKSAQDMSEGAEVRALPDVATIQCGLSYKDSKIVYKSYPTGAYMLPKGLGLKFSIKSSSVPTPYAVTWKAENEGDEAQEGGQLTWTRNEPICWTSTQYRGTQRMRAEIWKDGKLRAKSTHVVRIA